MVRPFLKAVQLGVEKCPDTLMDIILEKKYEPEKIFNIDETGLLWKKMSSRTYLMNDVVTPPGVLEEQEQKPAAGVLDTPPKKLDNESFAFVVVPPVVLLLDNAGGHHADVHSEGVQTQLLPPNTTPRVTGFYCRRDECGRLTGRKHNGLPLSSEKDSNHNILPSDVLKFCGVHE
ncbi:hypothetical protein M514_26636 [Trichuris suis]|uniref:DDE-1 domain-containing protein n=1 Tax=Trichuris suis TaxID=68888 RepID=A0A085MVF7_9BILA|nr:hypothetical protein M514_26636 [Trichuris suis]